MLDKDREQSLAGVGEGAGASAACGTVEGWSVRNSGLLLCCIWCWCRHVQVLHSSWRARGSCRWDQELVHELDKLHGGGENNAGAG